MLIPPTATDTPLPHWPPLLATRGPGGRSALHAHHGMHFVIASRGTLRVRVGGRWLEAPGLLTAPDIKHEIDATGREVLLLFLDPESAAGLLLRSVLESELHLLSDGESKQLLEGATPNELMRQGGVTWAERAVGVLGGRALPGRRLHPRVRRALEHLRVADAASDSSLEAMSRIAGLSEGRFMHVFTESVGIPLRPYLAWLRLQRAAARLVSGSSATEAAHAAGFADSAHMTRSFRRMLGVPPSELQRRA